MPTLIRVFICLFFSLSAVHPDNAFGQNDPSMRLGAPPVENTGLNFNDLKSLLKSAKSATVLVFQPGQMGLKVLDSLAVQGQEELSRKTWKRLKKAMLRKSGYDFSMYKNCLFHPAAGLRLRTKTGRSDVLMDFTCDTWYLYDEKAGFRQFEADDMHDIVLEQIHVLFPETQTRLKLRHQ